jgi:hypothetical protein
LGRRGVSYVSQLQDSFLYGDLLLVLLYHLLILLLFGGHELHQLVLYIHAMTMQQFSIQETTSLKTRTHKLASSNG